MKTAREMSALIGTLVYMEPVRGLFVACTVTNAKVSYGHPRVEVAPVAGQGKAWVSLASIQPAAGARDAAQQEVSTDGRS